MSTGDTGRRDRIIRLRAAETELHGRPGEAVVFRLFLTNDLRDSEDFTYSVDALNGEFDGDLRAPEGPVGPGETIEIELEIKVPEDGAPGQYPIRIAALLSRDNTIGVAQDLVVTVDAPAPRSAPLIVDAPRSSVLPWVAGAVGAAVIGLVGLLLVTQIGSGDSEPEIVQGVSVTPTTIAATFSPSPAASVAATPTPTTTPVIESDTPTAQVTAPPTQTAVPVTSAPSVAIASPADGQVFCPGPPNGTGVYTAEISLQGNVSDDEDGVLPNDQITWTWALNGGEPQFLANSATVSLEITASAATYKTVDVVLEATDSDGSSSESSIQLFVGGPQAPACLN